METRDVSIFIDVPAGGATQALAGYASAEEKLITTIAPPESSIGA
jgi:hypothetical protein